MVEFVLDHNVKGQKQAETNTDTPTYVSCILPQEAATEASKALGSHAKANTGPFPLNDSSPIVHDNLKSPKAVYCKPAQSHNIPSYPPSNDTLGSIFPISAVGNLVSVDTTVPSSGGHSAFDPDNTNAYPGIVDSSELEVLDYLTSQHASLTFFNTNGSQLQDSAWALDESSAELLENEILQDNRSSGSPDIYAAYYPDTRYRELHTTLRHHMVATARNTILTRPVSPINEHTEPSQVACPSRSSRTICNSPLRPLQRGLRPIELPPERQFELWQNYLQEVATWLDMFDCERHFQTTIPMLAKSADHLHYSILALSARQMERKNPENPYTESLGLYQEAIGLIVKELHTLDVAVIASCVLLCVLEMMSSSPKAWARHLEGCAMLLKAAGINGAAGDVRQALFWCFARMDCLGSFLGDVPTKIPTSLWFVPSPKMSMAVNHFKATSGCDSYANYAVFICASVVSVISSRHTQSIGTNKETSPTSSYSARWRALFRLLEDWYENRPQAMCPLMSCSLATEDTNQPFPLILYTNPEAINGNQLYHASALLMLQEKPKDVHLSRSHRSILWHARQVCGIAMSNCNHGAWINALQPLWIAGKLMSHTSEHRAILGLLSRIEAESGWATAWRMQDLRDYWGPEDVLS